MAALFRAEELAGDERSATDPNFEVNGVRYKLSETKTAYNRLAAMGPQRDAVYQLLAFSERREAMRLHLLMNLVGGEDVRAELRRVAVRYSCMLDHAASGRADRITLHAFEDRAMNKWLVVFAGVFVETPLQSVPAIGVWCSKTEDDRGPALVPNRAPVDLQPFNTCRYQLPTTGGLDYVCSATPDGLTFTAPLDAVLVDCQPFPGEERRPGEHRERLVLRPFNNFRSGLKVSTTFKTLARSIKSEAAGIGRDADLGQRVGAEIAHQEYLERLAQTQEGVIDISSTQWTWSANTIVEVRKRLLDELQKDAADGDRMLFTNARAFLNRMFARGTPPLQSLWIKIPKADHEAEGAGLLETTVNAFLKEAKHLFLMLPAPTEPEVLQRTLHGKVKVNDDGDFSFIEWYLQFGVRCVQGTRFWPLCIGETLLDQNQRDYINTFAGFNCQSWIRDNIEECMQAERGFRQGGDEDDSLRVLRDHILNICCGDEHTFTARLTWISLTCFYPSLKIPTAFIDKGPPGCGKSSFTEALARWLLNKCHVRKVTKLDQIVGRFNAITERTVLTVVEERDFKSERQAAMNALNEIITAKDIFIEKKNIDGSMGRSFDRIVAHTNVPNPIVLPDGQRRWYVNEFDLRIAKKMEDDPVFLDCYLKRLFAAYEDERVWKAFAYQLYMLVPSMQSALEELKRFHLRRRFNPNTAKLQLESMIHFPERSVLGWLWKHLANDVPMCGRGFAAIAFVLEDELVPDFTKWSDWRSLRLRNDRAAEKFKDADWRNNEGERWWCKVAVENVYSTYASYVGKLSGRSLDQMSFHSELQRILGFSDPAHGIRPTLRCGSEVGQKEVGYGDNKRTVAHSVEWYCFAPRNELREAISRALPAALNFDWKKWDEERKK